MFEAQIAYYLNEYLGKYVEGIDRESLNISIYAGDVVLRNLRLKQDALEELDLPVTVQAGMLGSLTLKVPWNNLGGVPVVVEVNELYLLVRPRDSTAEGESGGQGLDVDSFEERFQEFKLSRVRKKENSWIKGLQKMKIRDSEQKQKGFLKGLIDTVVSNLQISINSIHIRYEDNLTRPGHSFACGFTLEQLCAYTVDDKGDRTFIAPKAMNALRKLLQMKRISIYFDCDTVLWSPVEGWNELGPGGWREWFEPDITKDNTGRNFVLRPIDGRATYIRRWKDIDQEKDAATELDVQLDSVSVSISRDQYCNYSLLLSEISLYTARLPFIGFRPQCRPRPGVQAKAWWIYLSYVHRQTAETRKFKWEEIIKSVRLRSKYISLYKVELKMKDLKSRKDIVIPEDVSMLYQRDILIMKELERELPESTLVMFRRVAYTEYSDEKDKEAEIARSQQQRGWLGWLMGSAQPATGDQPIATEKSISQDGRISSDEYDTILEVLKTQEESMSLKFETPHTLMSKFIVRLGSVSLNLMASLETSILLGSMNGIAVQILEYPQTMDLTIKVAGMGIDSSQGAFMETGSGVVGPNSDALSVKFTRNPQEKNADAILNIELAPSFVYYDPRTVGMVTQFFRPPEEFLIQELADLSVVAASQIEKAKKLASDYAVAAWSERPKLELRLVLNAPKISLPSKESDVHLALDLGLFVIETDKNSDSMKTPHEKALYECIKVTGNHVTAFLTEGPVDWEASTPSERSGHLNLHLLEECSIDMCVNVARYSDVEYPMIRMYPKIPSLKFCVSPIRIENFMKVLQNSISFEEIQANNSLSSESSWLDSADWKRECYLLEWGTVKASASWNLYQLVLFRTTLYVLKRSSQGDIVSQIRISGNLIVSKVPEEISPQHMLVIHNSLSSDWAGILRSAQAWVLMFNTEEDLQSCIEEVNASIHRMKMDEFSQSMTESDETVDTHKYLFYVESHLSEMQLILAGKSSKEIHGDGPEDYLISVSASKGSVNFVYGSEEVNLDLSLLSLEVNDMLMSKQSGKEMYLAKKFVGESETDENLADFSIKVLSPTHPEYKGVKTSLQATFGSLFFYCNRPTVACLISLGNDMSLSLAGEAVETGQSNTKSDLVSLPAPEIVVFCQDQGSVAFAMDFTFKRLKVILGYEQDEKLLAEASIEDFRFGLKNISDGTVKIMSSLGNLSVTDLTLDISNPYGQICGLRDMSTSSLVSIDFVMYPAHVEHSLRVPANMLCYCLSAHLSKLRVVFLYRFVQEILNYLSVLMEMKPDVELLGDAGDGAMDEPQLASKDGQPLILQMDLSMDAPLIVIPRSSLSDDGLKLDLGTLSLSNRVYRKSLPESDASLIDASTLHLSGIQLFPCSITNGDSVSLVDLSDNGWKVSWRRPLQDVSNTDIPMFEVEVDVETLNASMSDKEYEVITTVVSTNISEKPCVPVQRNFSRSSAQILMSPRSSVIQVENSQQLPVPGREINVRLYINLKHLQLNLWKDRGDSKTDLSFLQMNNLYFSYTSYLSGKTVIDLCIPKLEISDTRRNVPAETSLVISSGKRASFLMLKYSTDMDERSVSLILQKPLIVLELGFLLDLAGFFVPMFAYSKTEPLPFRSSDIVLEGKISY
jgi:vacuolar protein sorting-associated protein 13A/C